MEEIKPSGTEDDLAVENGNILADSDVEMLNQIAYATRKGSDVYSEQKKMSILVTA